MRTRSTRRLARNAARALPVCAALALAPALAGCGHAAKGSSGGVADAIEQLPTPSDGVIARVGPYTIGAEAFKHAYAETVEAEPAATRAAAVPPDYASCAERLASIAKSLGLTMPSRAQRAAKCKERYEAAKNALLSRAILGLWVAAEAKELGFQVGLGPQDELIGPRLQTESRRLTKLIAHDAVAQLGTLSRTRLRSYYESHRNLYAIPEKAELRIVRATSASAAKRIRREIAQGRTFASEADHLPQQPAPAHGLVPRYVSGEYHEPALNKAIFAAKPHTLEGPLYTPAITSWFVFEVVRDYPSYQRPFAQVERKVLAQLPVKLREERLASFSRGWAAKWRAQTKCSPAYAVELCGGAQSTPSALAAQASGVFG